MAGNYNKKIVNIICSKALVALFFVVVLTFSFLLDFDLSSAVFSAKDFAVVLSVTGNNTIVSSLPIL